MQELHFIDRKYRNMFGVRRHYWDPWRNRPDPQTFIDKREPPGLTISEQVRLNGGVA